MMGTCDCLRISSHTVNPSILGNRDELDAKIFLQKAEQMFTQTDTYGIIFAWKKIYLIQIKTNFHMVEDMSILCSIILSGVQSTEKRF